MQTYAILQCTNPECNLRCPATDGQRIDRCPWCHAPTVIDVAGAIERETAVATAHPDFALPLTLVLDNVRSTFNVGSILRSANGAGVREVYLGGFTPGVENPRVGKTALGAEIDLDLHKRNNTLDLVRELRGQGATILALESAAAAQELKTKPTQHSVKELLGIGIQADILLCRSERQLSREIKQKIAAFCNVEERAVIGALTVDSIYAVPLGFAQEGVDALILKYLHKDAPDQERRRENEC